MKITHDGGIALIDNNEFIFSIELEKVNDNNRYAGISDLSEVQKMLASKGFFVNVKTVCKWGKLNYVWNKNQ